MNHLHKEKSPYLLQHAQNPVHWYPWGEAAFAAAHRDNKPILLSIGYSTCHWCHVMEHESFENIEIADLMNQFFISIKVDREERPDIDHVYMSAVTAMTGQGGWPLTVFLTPDKKPFWGGTYFPPEPRYGSPGFRDILTTLHSSWQNNPAEILSSGNSLTELLRERVGQQTLSGRSEGRIVPSENILKKAFDQFLNYFDDQFGGFGSQPKFPSAHNLSFLLRYWKRVKEPRALAMVEKTLIEMHKGGLFDHLGGGFHRYSTDQCWQVPHFEKMLYDQAIIAKAYLEAYQATANAVYSQAARQTLDYVLRDMTDSQGGFYSAEDADSLPPENLAGEKKEGAFYLWRSEEIQEILTAEEYRIFSYCFGILPDGNAQFDPHGEFTGKNILFAEHSREASAEYFAVSIEKVRDIMVSSRQKLFQSRLSRPRPHLDNKVLTDWNGLMISSLALAGRVLKEERYVRAAQDAAHFILKKLRTTEQKLLHRFCDGESSIAATLSDYSFLIHGLLDLYEATFTVEYLKESLSLAESMLAGFWDEQGGAFYFCAHDAEELIVRSKEFYDGAMPSGNSMAALDLIRLFHFTADTKWEEMARVLFQSVSTELSTHPSSHAQMLSAFDFALGPACEIVFAADSKDTSLAKMTEVLFSKFIPNKTVVLKSANSNEAKQLIAMIPFLKDHQPLEGKATAYVCQNHSCHVPISEFEQFKDEVLYSSTV